jgi:methylglutaconyl-CoA hydratase
LTAFETILLDVDPRGVARLTLNRPEARNAISQQMISELRAAGRQLADDDRVRAVVLTGSGEHFCSGGDLKGMQQQATRDRAARIADATELAETLAELNRLPRPVIGRINGPAFGGGVGLISICDIAIGVSTAKFCLTEVRLGLIPATISPYVVARLGAKNSRRVMLNATDMDAAAAARLGLLDEVVAQADLDASVEREIQAVLRCAPGAVADCKRLIEFVSSHAEPENIAYTASGLADRWETAEIAEGIAAFLGKRPPNWHVVK